MASFKYGGLIEQVATTVTAAGTTTLIDTSPQIQVFTGSTTQNVVLPDATTFAKVGTKYEFYNNSTGALTVRYSDSSPLAVIAANSSLLIKLISNGTTNGIWVAFTVNTVAGVAFSGASYYMSANTATGANSQINFDTAIVDTGSFVTTGATWKFTATRSGYLQVSAVIESGTSASTVYTVYKNNAPYASIITYSGTGFGSSPFSGLTLVPVVNTDFIDIRCSNAATQVGASAPFTTKIDISFVGS